MRLFTALELPESVRTNLADLIEHLRSDYPDASWVRAKNLHVTLKFLGEVADADVAKLTDALQVSPAGAIRLWPSHIECFPPRGPVRVIAVGLEGDTERLRSVYDEIEERCAALGFAREGRTYRPHVTLARVRCPLPPSSRQQLAAKAAGRSPSAPFAAEEFVLFHSQPGPKGSQYLPLARLAV